MVSIAALEYLHDVLASEGLWSELPQRSCCCTFSDPLYRARQERRHTHQISVANLQSKLNGGEVHGFDGFAHS